jgi:ankyrin repeat protein
MAAQKPHHERIADPLFRRAVDLLDAGDAGTLREHLREHPSLVHERVTFDEDSYFTRPSLLEFAAENPVRNDRLPPNIVEIAETIIDAGATPDAITSTLTLVASGRVARECGVQVPLIALLSSRGANVDEALLPALAHGEFEAVEALLRHGATLDLVAVAGLGRLDEARRALASADALSRHRALALAAQHGHGEIVALLLDAGEDPNRYNPTGCHAHSTPLHQAALAGHMDVVRTLVEHGARTDLRDTLFNGTPLGWAEHGKQDAVAGYLRSVS